MCRRAFRTNGPCTSMRLSERPCSRSLQRQCTLGSWERTCRASPIMSSSTSAGYRTGLPGWMSRAAQVGLACAFAELLGQVLRRPPPSLDKSGCYLDIAAGARGDKTTIPSVPWRSSPDSSKFAPFLLPTIPLVNENTTLPKFLTCPLCHQRP